MLLTQSLGHSDFRLAEPHRRLMAAVLKAVIDDCRDSAARRATMDGGMLPDLPLHDDVFDYVASTDRVWPFSFENLCDALGMDAECLRQELRKERHA